MNSDNGTPAIDRQAIADQVIVSAGNILVAAGFGRQEIGLIFRQAADHLAPPSPRSETRSNPGHVGPAGIHAAFERSKPVAQLQPLIARAQKLLPFRQEGAGLKEGFDLAMQMAPLLAEAQSGLRLRAQEAGLTLFASREEAAINAGTMDSPAICLEDFETAYSGAFAAIGAVAEELLRRQDSEAFSFLLDHLAENSVVIDRSLQASIEKALHLLHT